MEIVSETTVTARKEHRCELCFCKINKGQKYRKQFNKDCGDVWTFNAHEECSELTSILDFSEYYGIDNDAFGDEMTGYLRRYHYDEAKGDIEAGWKNLSDYDLAKKILAELKAKNIEHITWYN